jgi:uncharacterized membrane protein HdeD (DUF308 family)
MTETLGAFHDAPSMTGTSALDRLPTSHVAWGRVALNTMFWAGLFVTINLAIANVSLSYPVGAVLLFVAIHRLHQVFGLGAYERPLYACATLTAVVIAVGYLVPDAMSLSTADDTPARVHESALHFTNLLGAWVLTKPMLELTRGHHGKSWGRWQAAQWATLAAMALSAVVAVLTLTDLPQSVQDSAATMTLQVVDLMVVILAGVMTLLALRSTRTELAHRR